MNAFQKQLMLGDKCMAELAGQDRNGVGQAVPPARVSIEEFEATQHRLAADLCQACGSSLSSGTTKKDGTQTCPVCGTSR